MGPVMCDVDGTSLTPEDKELLGHPLVGGLILFTRNYQSPAQLTELITDIRRITGDEFLVAVDHEGGRVQRFREQFTHIPAMGNLWELAGQQLERACQLAQQCGELMAMEVRAVGIDISFAPVLDINAISDVIGDRSFHAQVDYITPLATAFIQGMRNIGMKATGKHFPGHGNVKADSHVAMAVDPRTQEDIFHLDMLPFSHLISSKFVDALMPAHVIYPQVCDKSVGFSVKWLQEILRGQLGFDGVIFSDDLSMHGASSIGGYIERSEAAQSAGCDMLLLCNNRSACVEVLDNANIRIIPESRERIRRMLATEKFTWQAMKSSPRWQQLNQQVSGLNEV